MVYFLYFIKKIQIHCQNAKFNVTVFTFMHHRLKAIIIHAKRKHVQQSALIVHIKIHSYCLLAFSKSNF